MESKMHSLMIINIIQPLPLGGTSEIVRRRPHPSCCSKFSSTILNGKCRMPYGKLITLEFQCDIVMTCLQMHHQPGA
jgi:hypothetical protein